MKEAEETEKEIDAQRNNYRPVAFRASTLFFCIVDLATVDPMYQYSLGWFHGLFVTACENAAPSDTIDDRISDLQDTFLQALYRNVCRSLFESHKLLFSFLLAVAIIR